MSTIMVTTFCGEGDDKQTTQDFKLYECHIFIITSLSLLLFHWVNSHLQLLYNRAELFKAGLR